MGRSPSAKISFWLTEIGEAIRSREDKVRKRPMLEKPLSEGMPQRRKQANEAKIEGDLFVTFEQFFSHGTVRVLGGIRTTISSWRAEPRDQVFPLCEIFADCGGLDKSGTNIRAIAGGTWRGG